MGILSGSALNFATYVENNLFLFFLLLALIGAGVHVLFSISFRSDRRDQMRDQINAHNPWETLSGQSDDTPQKNEAPKNDQMRRKRKKNTLIISIFIILALIGMILALIFGS